MSSGIVVQDSAALKALESKLTELLLRGLWFKKLVNSFLWIAADYQAFLFRSTLTLFTLRFLWFWHLTCILRFRFDLVPQPGIGPGRPEWARACKARLSASSSTGALVAPNVGAGELLAGLAAPTWFGPFGAALNSSSWYFSQSSSLCSGIRRGVMGTFHSVTPKHLPNYLNEFQFRWNTRKMNDGDRVAAAIKKIEGKRLEYRESVDNPPYEV